MSFKPEYDPQQFCNYHEVSKSRYKLHLVEEELSLSETEDSSTSSFPSLISAVSNPISKTNISYSKKESPSLCNYLKTTLSHEESAASIEEGSEVSEVTVYEENSDLKEETFQNEQNLFKVHPLIDANGWIKYASDPDPWNEEHYSSDDGIPSRGCDSILTPKVISSCSSKLAQLPDTKEFVLTRLQINKKGLRDISVLCDYKYFGYIDVSWNFISTLEALSNCAYLMYLNASHNKLTEVLSLKQPWFLTHANLRCNEIKEIGQNLSQFWSLRHLDLSYNLIEKIEGFTNLDYLSYLDLSHNHIRKIENLDCVHLYEIKLQFNHISECDTEGAGLHNLENVREINLSHNNISSLIPFQKLLSLKKLDISDNCITELYEIDNLSQLTKLYELNMTGNGVCTRPGYIEFVIYRLASLTLLDCVSVKPSERVAAKMLLGPDIFTSTQHLRGQVELWSQLAAAEINTETVPFDQPPLPLVVLVGTFLNNKEEIADSLVVKLPYHIYRCKKYTTLPSLNNYDPENLIPVSVDKFNVMIKQGKFLVYYKEIGFYFGISNEEISKCVVEGKIGLIDTNLQAALVMRSMALHPFMVLCVIDNVNKYTDMLKSKFMEMDLWRYKKAVENLTSSGLTRNSSREESAIFSQNDFNSKSTKDSESTLTNKMPSANLKSSDTFKPNIDYTTSKSVTWDLGKPSSEMEEYSLQYEQLDNEYDLRCEEENFVWSWSIDSTVSTVSSEPDEDYLNMVRGTDNCVRSTLQQQEMYIELHNLQPGLFVETVHTDEVESAVKKIEKTCSDILKNRPTQGVIGNLLGETVCEDYIVVRLGDLMNNFLNSSIEM